VRLPHQQETYAVLPGPRTSGQPAAESGVPGGERYSGATGGSRPGAGRPRLPAAARQGGGPGGAGGGRGAGAGGGGGPAGGSPPPRRRTTHPRREVRRPGPQLTTVDIGDPR